MEDSVFSSNPFLTDSIPFTAARAPASVVIYVLETSLADCLAVFGVVALGFWCVDYEAYFLVNNEGKSLSPGFNP